MRPKCARVFGGFLAQAAAAVGMGLVKATEVHGVATGAIFGVQSA